jgi:hypothetical protein
MPKFTFKKRPQTRWYFYNATDIKYSSETVGHITKNDTSKNWIIRLQIPRSLESLEEYSCPWMWFDIKRAFNTEDEARLWLNENREQIIPMLWLESSQPIQENTP